ncbi:MAG: ribosome maturation factor RimM [Gammaproteobacteria bacterium]
MMKKNSSIDKSLFVLIAKIGKTRGLKGEFFLRSFAEKLETLIAFKKFFSLQSFIMEEIFFEYIKKSNNNIIAKLKSIDDIEGIKSFGQKDIYVLKSELPELEKNEAYWFELEKMQVLNLEGQHLGNVDRVDNFGANDVLKVQKKNKTLLIPFIKNRVIISINKKENSILVDWQEDY